VSDTRLSEGTFCCLSLEAAVDDRHVAQRAAIGQSSRMRVTSIPSPALANGLHSDEFSPCPGLSGALMDKPSLSAPRPESISMAKARGIERCLRRKRSLAGYIELTLRANKEKARHLYLPW
jgi:hypothetical protein